MALTIFTIEQLKAELEKSPVKPLMRASGVNRHTIMNIRDGVNRNPSYRILTALVAGLKKLEAEKTPADDQ